MISRLRARCRAGEDRGSLPMFLLLSTVGVLLAGLVVPIVIQQDHATRFDSTRARSLAAAQAGIDVVVGRIRNTLDTNPTSFDFGNGNPAWLPCGPFSGNAAADGTSAYYAEVLYYTADPVNNPDPQANAPMRCSPGYGPYSVESQVRTPSYACIISTGIDEAAPITSPVASNNACTTASGVHGSGANGATRGRTLVTTYRFNTDAMNLAGGTIAEMNSNFCIDSGPSPSAGTVPMLQDCGTSTPPPATQSWAYRCDLSIQLVSSVTSYVLRPDTRPACGATCAGTAAECRSVDALGLCLDATSHNPGSTVFLSPCSRLGSTPANQKWSNDDSAQVEGSRPDESDLDGTCWSADAVADNQPLNIQPCHWGWGNQLFYFSPSTGPGAAGAPKQLVNFQQFGRCADVYQWTPWQGIVLYPCKQNPNPANYAWNQTITPNPALPDSDTGPVGPVEWTTTTDGRHYGGTPAYTTYCVESPQYAGGIVSIVPCPADFPTDPHSPFLWTVNRLKDVGGVVPMSYDKRYTIVDGSGYCLSFSDQNLGYYSRIDVDTCNGSAGQKWNADPRTGFSAFQNTHELGG